MLAGALLALLLPLAPSPSGGDASGCVDCHAGIEDMHPAAALSCTDCHGGDPTATTAELAHVPAPGRPAGDERVAPRDRDLARRRFVNPMDLRVAERVCGDCHEETAAHVIASLHGTTAGHLSDGFYEMGVLDERGSRYGVFPISADDAPRGGGEVERLVTVPGFSAFAREEGTLQAHYADLARKECMQCHLWSKGRAIRGRVGFDGDYRGEGCAACHVSYATDGLSRSADRHVAKGEPGHPREHSMTRAPSTDTCTSCHYGDASIGLHFRGLSQLPPGAPGGPDVPGTTDAPLNQAYYLSDPDVTPPDVHHERGMHCIDCHTANDVMGDGELHGQMEHAVEISCSDCHGTFDAPATLRTEEGTPLEHLRREADGRVVLVSKVTGREHPVPQVVHVLDPARPEHNPRAAEAMTSVHGEVECYTCHAGWNVNFLGFHFTRNESLSQLDLLSGKVTPGRVTTQEKVFATWKSFYAGRNETGAVAPYLTGFSTMGSVYDEDGELVLDQVMPVTSAGLSGMSMIHHQLHSTRPTARSCVECHRSGATWGLGSPNFRLTRSLAFAADRRGIEVIALRRERLSDSLPLAKLPLPDVVDLALDCDDLQGHARTLFAAEGGSGVHALDVTDPTAPRRVSFTATIQPRGIELSGHHLYVADGIGGLKIFDVEDPREPRLVGELPMFDAHDVEVAWPYAYVADGPGGLAIVDVGTPIAPRFVTAIDVNRESRQANDVTHVRSLFQYSRPTSVGGRPADRRTDARMLCAVLDQEEGLVLVDVTEPTDAAIVFPPAERRSEGQRAGDVSYRGLWLASHVDLAESQGGSRTRERDYAYLLREVTRGDGEQRTALVAIDVTRPSRPEVAGATEAGYATEQLTPLAVYNQPFLETVVLASGDLGAFVTDVTVSAEPQQAGTLPGLRDVYAVVAEEFPLDRMVEESGRRLKDVSHEGSGWLSRADFHRVLTVPGVDLGRPPGALPVLGGSARAHLTGFDVDGSGLLEGDEIRRAGATSLDADGDGRIAMIELARSAGMLAAAESRVVVNEVELADGRAGRDGDLARLLDGVNPYAFDEDGDDRIDRDEMEEAFFAALDLDADGRLSPGELSRHPGDTRELRYGDELAARVLAKRDDNRDGRVSRREFDLGDAEWRALDVDQQGYLELDRRALEADRERGYAGPRSGWPSRRGRVFALPPVVTLEGLLAALDGDGDGELSRSELGRREELLRDLDRDGDGELSRDELQRGVDLVAARGTDATSDGFRHRYDLDGDGEVDPSELPSFARPLRSRLVTR